MELEDEIASGIRRILPRPGREEEPKLRIGNARDEMKSPSSSGNSSSLPSSSIFHPEPGYGSRSTAGSGNTTSSFGLEPGWSLFCSDTTSETRCPTKTIPLFSMSSFSGNCLEGTANRFLPSVLLSASQEYDILTPITRTNLKFQVPESDSIRQDESFTQREVIDISMERTGDDGASGLEGNGSFQFQLQGPSTNQTIRTQPSTSYFEESKSTSLQSGTWQNNARDKMKIPSTSGHSTSSSSSSFFHPEPGYGRFLSTAKIANATSSFRPGPRLSPSISTAASGNTLSSFRRGLTFNPLYSASTSESSYYTQSKPLFRMSSFSGNGIAGTSNSWLPSDFLRASQEYNIPSSIASSSQVSDSDFTIRSQSFKELEVNYDGMKHIGDNAASESGWNASIQFQLHGPSTSQGIQSQPSTSYFEESKRSTSFQSGVWRNNARDETKSPSGHSTSSSSSSVFHPEPGYGRFLSTAKSGNTTSSFSPGPRLSPSRSTAASGNALSSFHRGHKLNPSSSATKSESSYFTPSKPQLHGPSTSQGIQSQPSTSKGSKTQSGTRPKTCLVKHRDKHLSQDAFQVLTKALRENTYIKTSVLFCKVEFASGQIIYFEQFGDTTFHAEVFTMARLRLYQSLKHTVRFVTMYMPTSPCPNCSHEILEFVNSSIGIKQLYMKWGSVYRHYHKTCQTTARMLESSSKITITIMDDEDYLLLEQQVYPSTSCFALVENCPEHAAKDRRQ